MPVDSEVNSRASDIEEFFRAFVFDDLVAYSAPARGQLLVEIQRMRKLHAAGLWEPGPRAREIERSSLLRSGRKHNEAKPQRKPYLPFPDEFVSQLAARCLWLIHDVYPYFIELGEELVAVWDETKVEPLTDDAVRLRRDRRLRKILSDFEWYDRHRKLIESPPFPIRQRVSQGFRSCAEGDGDASFIWPPKNYSQVIGLFNAIQTAHLIVYFLSTGSRKSEVLTLKRSCIEYESDGRAYANGRLFKVVANHGGTPREWALPNIALTALEQQTYLGFLYEKLHTIGLDSDSKLIDSDNLWSRTSAFRKIEGNAALTEVNRRLVSFATYFDLDLRPGGQAIHSHRFRKTLARLVALSLKESPKILMELFGHKSIEMTLAYILTDKDLQGDVEVVSREIIVMRAKEIIEDMISAEADPERCDDILGGYGGKAAESLSSAITTQRAQFRERGIAWAVSGPLELAKLLTLQGRCWEQVRRGVMCTKLPSEVGPCNRNIGRPEPSKCDTGCTHRLEERFLKDDVDGAIGSCVEAYGQVMNDESSLSASHFAAQIRAHLPRFKDLESKWSRHPVVKTAMSRGRGGGDE